MNPNFIIKVDDNLCTATKKTVDQFIKEYHETESNRHMTIFERDKKSGIYHPIAEFGSEPTPRKIGFVY